MSNLIKSGFVAFTQTDALVIDANQNKIIQAIDAATEEMVASSEDSVEEALAEALIRDAELDGADFGDDLLTLDSSELPNVSEGASELRQMSEEVVNSAKAEAEEIVNKAHDEAESLRAAAYDEAESIRKTAHDEGYETGYREAMETANAELEREREALSNERANFEELMTEREEALKKETEKTVVDLLCQYIPAVTGIEIENQRDVLLYMVNRAVRDMDNSSKFVIRVSPEDYPQLEERKEEIYGAGNPNVEIELFEDAKLSRYQCQIETDSGMVDLSLDVQLDNLMKALKLMIKD